MKKSLIIVDPQVDFVTGTMAVKGAQEAMQRLCNAFEQKRLCDEYCNIFITFDHHPLHHCSFVEEGGMFPVHCIADTVGAAMCAEIEKALTLVDVTKTSIRHFYKGVRRTREEFSVFQNEKKGRKFGGMLKFKNYDEIHVAGLCGDYCVMETIRDMMEYVDSYKITVLKDFIVSIDGGEKFDKFIEENTLFAIQDKYF